RPRAAPARGARTHPQPQPRPARRGSRLARGATPAVEIPFELAGRHPEGGPMTQTTAQVRVTHRYDAPPERVFHAWLDPKLAGRFLFATPTGRMIKAEIDPKVGGQFNFTDRRPDMGD